MVRFFGYAYHRSTQVRLYKARESIPTWPVSARLRGVPTQPPSQMRMTRVPVACWPFVCLTVAEVQCRRSFRRGALVWKRRCFLSFLNSHRTTFVSGSQHLFCLFFRSQNPRPT